MNKQNLLKLLLPIGLLCMTARFIITRYFKITDFADGFFMGLGITLILGSLFTLRLKKPLA